MIGYVFLLRKMGYGLGMKFGRNGFAEIFGVACNKPILGS